MTTIALVGRPNVGKSTLFNRLTGKRLAIVHDTPGVTRDWKRGSAALGGWPFTLLDTPGLEEAGEDSLAHRMRRQTEAALREADQIWFLLDGRVGITPQDEVFATWLRAQNRPVRVVVNKCEAEGPSQAALAEAWGLGFGAPLAISAEHGIGMEELYEALTDTAPPSPAPDGPGQEPKKHAPKADPEGEAEPEEEAEEFPLATAPSGNPYLQLAVIGRPNAGKSTLINALLQQHRLLTGAEAGLTRDAIAVEWEWRDRPIRLVDTAGLRRRARVEDTLEKMSNAESLHAIRFAHVCILVVDACLGLEKQDLAIARLVEKEGRGLVIAYNKWDAVPHKADAIVQVQDRLLRSLPQLGHPPVLPLSATRLTRTDRDTLLGMVAGVYDAWNTRVPTPKLNTFLRALQTQHPPPLVAGRRIKIRYITQIKTRPPTFLLFLNKPEELPDSYERYLATRLRQEFDLAATPLRLYRRKGENPYAPSKKE